MVKMKRKLAAGADDKRAHEVNGAPPVSLALVGCAPPPGASPLLDLVVAEMEAAATYYLQLSALQRLKAQLLADAAGASASASAAASAAELSLVLDWLLALYLHPASRPLRKTLVAVVAAAERRSDALLEGAAAGASLAAARAAAAVSGYCARLGAQASSASYDARGSWSVASSSAEVATLLAVLELPLLAAPLLESSNGAIEGLLACLAAHLTHHVQPILAAAPSGAASAAAAAPAAASLKRSRNGAALESVHAAEALASVECCGFVLTGVIALLSTRGGKAWAPGGLSSRSSAAAADDQTNQAEAADWAPLRVCQQLCGGCVALLEGGGLVPKDQLTQAALALVLLCRALWAADRRDTAAAATVGPAGRAAQRAAEAGNVAATLLGLQTTTDDHAAASATSTAMSSALLPPRALLSFVQGRCSLGLPPLAKLALLRGVAHGVDLAVLLQTPAQGAGGGRELLCGQLYAAVAASCSDANPLVQVYAFQVLEALLGRLASALQAAPLHDNDAAAECEEAPLALPSADVLALLVSDTLELTLRFWEQPAKPLARVLPTVFTRVVELSAFATHDAADDATADATASSGSAVSAVDGGRGEWTVASARRWAPLLRRIGGQPATRKGKYAALAVLVPHIVKASVVQGVGVSPETVSAHAHALAASRVVRGLLRELLPSALAAATAPKAGEAVATAGAAQLLALLLHALKQHHRDARLSLPGGLASGGNASGESRRGRGGNNSRTARPSAAGLAPPAAQKGPGGAPSPASEGAPSAKKARASAAVGASSENAAAAALEAACVAAAVDAAEAAGRAAWAGPLCGVLLWAPAQVAARGVEYLLGEALTADADAAPALLAELARRSSSDSSSSSSSSRVAASPERLLWARLHVVRLARLHGARDAHALVYAPGNASGEAAAGNASNARSLSVEAGVLPLAALSGAMVHFSSDLRLAALEVVAAATKTKSFPTQPELDAFTHALPYSLNCGGADQRHRVMRLVQRLVIRARDTGRGLETTSKDADAEKAAEVLRRRVDAFVRGLVRTLRGQLYPGAPFSRELLALELLHLVATEVIDHAGWSDAHANTPPKHATKPTVASKEAAGAAAGAAWSVAGVLQEELWASPAACRALLALLLSSWDRSRALAKQLLLRFSLPLPGVQLVPPAMVPAKVAPGAPSSSSSSSGCLLGDALLLCGSPRQTEADAGALALHLAFQTAVLGRGQRLPLLALATTAAPATSARALESAHAGGGDPATAPPVAAESAAFGFLSDLCSLAEVRLGALVPVFAAVHAGVSHRSHAPAVGDFKGRAADRSAKTESKPEEGAANEDEAAAPEPLSPPGVALELVNGLLVALKLCVASSAPLLATLMADAQALQHATLGRSNTLQSTTAAAAAVVRWCALLERCVAAAVRALQVAMVVVADAGPEEDGEGGEGGEGSGGGEEDGEGGACLQSFTNPAAKPRRAAAKPVAANGGAAATGAPVNAANGLSRGGGAKGYGEDAGAAARGGGKESNGDAEFLRFQAAVVGGWQMARDACGCLAALAQAMPLPTEDEAGPAEGLTEAGAQPQEATGVCLPSSFLRVATVRAVGDALLDALQRLRHTGAIVAAQTGFQALCRALLAPTSARGTTFLAPLPPTDAASARSGGTARALRALPSEWALSVVLRLEASGGAGLYVLRRSASFGYSFLSIARADPGLGGGGSGGGGEPFLAADGGPSEGTGGDGSSSSGGGTVLPFIMEKLLGCAEATTTFESADYRVGVHALNVLRLIFADAQVGDSVSGQVPRGLRCAVRGFQHAQWAVRNSAMMLFTAIVQRTVANAKNSSAGGSGAEAALARAKVPLSSQSLSSIPPASTGASSEGASVAAEAGLASSAGGSASSGYGGDRGATAAGFFHRFPSLAPFVLAELEEATSTATQDALHPSLVPLLLLLSRLRPSAEAAEANTLVLVASSSPPSSIASGSAALVAVPLPVFLARLLGLVLRCRSQRFHAARTMAARAAAVLCPVDRAARLAASLCHSLPAGDTAAESSEADGGAGGESSGSGADGGSLEAGCGVGACPRSANAVHGTLLLVKELAATALAHAQQTPHPSNDAAAPAESGAEPADGNGASSGGAASSAAALLLALSARVAPLVAHAGCPPPLRLAALEALQVAGAFKHALPSAVGPWAAEVLPPCVAAAADDLLGLPLPTPAGLGASTTAGAASAACAVPLERVAAPWLSLLRAALARAAVFASFQDARDDGHAAEGPGVLASLVLSSDHDVRCAAIKAVKKVMRHLPPLPATDLGTVAPAVLWLWGRQAAPLEALLFEALRRENYPPSQRRLLTCLATLRAATAARPVTLVAHAQAASGAHASSAPEARAWAAQWSWLARLHAGDVGGPDGDVPARSLALMGCLLGQATPAARSPVEVPRVHAAWLVHLRLAAQPHLKPSMRLAAVQSALASGCLAAPLTSSSGSSSSSSGVVLGVWFVCFALVLDDDEEVRDAAAQALAAHSSSTTSHALAAANELRPCNARALEVSMDALTAKVLAGQKELMNDKDLIGDYAGHLVGLWRSASISLGQAHANDEDDGAAPAGEGIAGATTEGSCGDNAGASRAIFEVEEDNLYSEPVLVAQLAARQLALLFSAADTAATSSPGLAAAARALDASLLEALRHMLRDARANPGGTTDAATGHASPLDGRACSFQAVFVAAAALGCGPALALSAPARALVVALQAAAGFWNPASVHPALRAAIDAAFAPRSARGGQAPSPYFFLAAPPTAQ